MANPPITKETRPRSEPQTKTENEWRNDPPLPPRELDPSGEGDALRSHAHPGDDTVFGANVDSKKKSAPAPAREKEPRTPNDAERSRTER